METWPQITFCQINIYIYIYINLIPTLTMSWCSRWSFSTHTLLSVSRLPGQISNRQRRQRSEDVPHYICTLHIYRVHCYVIVAFESRIEKDTPDTSIRVTVVFTDYPGFGHDGILSASIDLTNSTWTTQYTIYYYNISVFINAK